MEDISNGCLMNSILIFSHYKKIVLFSNSSYELRLDLFCGFFNLIQKVCGRQSTEEMEESEGRRQENPEWRDNRVDLPVGQT